MARILIIEDDPLMLRMYEKVFKYEGFEVVLVNNGKEGVGLAKTSNPSLVVLDLMMPEMDGLQVLELLKKDETTKHIPVVILTNLVNDSVLNTAMSLGAKGYLVKSEISNEKIVEEVKKYLS